MTRNNTYQTKQKYTMEQMHTNKHRGQNSNCKDKKSIGSTIIELKFEVPNEKLDEFATYLSAIKKLLEK